MPINILAISNHGRLLGGGEHAFINLIARLNKSGYRPLALVPSIGEVQKQLISEGVLTDLLPLPQIRPWRLYSILKALVEIIAICRKNKTRIIYANGSRACFYGGCIGRIMRIPVVWHCRIVTPDPYFDPLLCRLCTCIVANSQATARRFKGRAEKKIKLVYNGLDLKWLQSENVDLPKEIHLEQVNLLILAIVSRQKRHDLALQAFKSIAAGNGHIHLYCVGGVDRNDTEWIDTLMKISRESGFSERIHWVDAVGDIRSWLRAATILLLPSDNESFGRVIVEAMASGVPVIATCGGGIPEIITHDTNGLMIPCGDADALAEAIQRLLADEDLRRRLIAAGLRRAQDFTLEAHVCAMTAVFKELCSE